VETSPRVVQQFFEAQATYWHDVYGGADVFSYVVRRREAIALAWIKGLGLAPQTRVLEVGCGAGGLAVKLAQMGMSVQALDTVPAMVALTRSQSVVAGVEGQLRASEGDVHSLSFRDASYQLVTALGVLPWLHSPARAMQEMGRVLAPGGFMVFSADNWTGLDQLIDPFRNPYLAPLKRAAKRALVRVGAKRDEPFAQPEVLRRGEVERILGDAGLTRIDSTTCGFGPFTMFKKQVLSDRLGIALDRRLQRMVDRGVPVFRSAGHHYMVLAQKLS
jgi:ubiquinone/menaquinone biosynthesis C-methylase UbiE